MYFLLIPLDYIIPCAVKPLINYTYSSNSLTCSSDKSSSNLSYIKSACFSNSMYVSSFL